MKKTILLFMAMLISLSLSTVSVNAMELKAVDSATFSSGYSIFEKDIVVNVIVEQVSLGEINSALERCFNVTGENTLTLEHNSDAHIKCANDSSSEVANSLPYEIGWQL